ncbi:efflux RND transporter periplasmic adaptor subunit [Botrimarina mediterranea]|uniref:Cation efflux system protein CusB n=1 Tax=Botrimarina mediterranea TaxID=2528022 RepID=A0A518K7L6_9BACT|nr:efflux RND transporter periplasmic adaptor subunit [Botrimarina mediterranea]QDV73790.1 Cation efflux system protein CusB precursor [Botrimarina mediterranea]
MNDKKNLSDEAPKPKEPPVKEAVDTPESTIEKRASRGWWVQLIAGPLLLVATGAALIASLGVAQRLGWITAGDGGGNNNLATSGGADTRTYICPMLCTPPQVGPGRCPVCEMELVPAASGGGPSDGKSVQIDSAGRRVANIQTASAKSIPLTRVIRAVGELNYDEGSLKTISAYVDGRLDRLYADFTGVVVEKGDHLALVYSPRLYSAQVELLLAIRSRENSRDATLTRVHDANRDMYQSSRQRLIELGMTEEQIQQLEAAGEANSRLHLCAPISGTVIKKYATEGQYVKEGQAIYELADLSTVWLMLELFPEDASSMRYGQQVKAEVQSLPGRTFTGRVAFIDPVVNTDTRTVGVRVVIPNEDAMLRVGDFAKATIDTPIGSGPDSGLIYDPQLANKWISPRHPHVVEDSPGKCRVCGVDLVPASRFGFTDQPDAAGSVMVVPRSAVLVAGDNAVLYVETEPGRFEIRKVVLGPRSGDQIVVLDGLSEGDQVAVSGNFLIDSQMQLAGNSSLIDPTKAESVIEFELDELDMPPIGAPMLIAGDSVTTPQIGFVSPVEEDSNASAELSPDDARLAKRQALCPVADMKLGSMGTPIKVMVEGRPVFICCEGCRERLLAEPAKYLAKLDSNSTEEEATK